MATCWQIVTKALYEVGGSATAQGIEARTEFAFCAAHGLDVARRYGLVECDGRGKTPGWRITQRGIDWCENRLTTMELRRFPGRQRPQFVGMRFVPTWLSALPRDIRLEQKEAVECS